MAQTALEEWGAVVTTKAVRGVGLRVGFHRRIGQLQGAQDVLGGTRGGWHRAGSSASPPSAGNSCASEEASCASTLRLREMIIELLAALVAPPRGSFGSCRWVR